MEAKPSRIRVMEETFPNEIIAADVPAESGSRDVTIFDREETFAFKGTTGFVEEEKSVFQKAGYLRLQESVPVVPRKAAILCLVLNCLFPGLGTATGAFASILWPCDQHMAARWVEVFIWNIMAAICQVITVLYFFIGYFWGIWWGITMIQKAPSPDQERKFSINLNRKKKQSYLERT